jgi:glycosyltransferase involved in cell wall biosynthesis
VTAPRDVAINALFFEPDRSAGMETYLRGLVPALAAARPQTRLHVVTTRKGARALRAVGWTDFCTLVQLPSDEGQRLRRLYSEQVRLPALARRRGWDVVHSLGSVAPAVPGARSVVTLHDVNFFHWRTFPLATTVAMRLLVARAARRADALLSGSEAARDDIARTLGVPPERIAVVPHGAGRPPDVEPLPEQEVRARHRLPDGARVVLCVAALRPHKNQELLVRALEHLPEDVVVVLAGHVEPYAETLGSHERLRIVGYVEDAELEGLWRLAACAAFPTRGEGFGLPVVEALGRGVPVACSDIAVLREVGDDLPHYFDPDDPAGAARAIVAAIEGPFDAAAARARAARFSWEAAAEGTHAAYERAMAMSHGARRRSHAPRPTIGGW